MGRNDRHIVIAIDGPAGSGKSTVSRLIAKKLGFLYLDTGAMYRALTLKAMRNNLDMNDEKALTDMAKETDIKLEMEPASERTKVFMDGEDVTLDIRTPELTDKIKYIAMVPGVRKVMVGIQRAMGQRQSVVLEGRDTTTAVFPDAEYKFYIDADLKERARRRFQELESLGMKASLKEVEEDARSRDISDQTRAVGPLKKAEDAVFIDTTSLGVDEVVNKILAKVNAG
ncbi:MAG: (d)CMP kinase [Candidatus Omnitrophica bacterium]|nr:(d)CMP kinase [Candidatus Omnitrophota bacterium]